MAAEELMVREFDRAIARVRDCKPVNSTRCYNRPRALAVVRAEQKAWKAWRDAHCDVMAFSLEGTSAEGQVRDDCKTKLTVERINVVKKIGRS